MEDKKQVVLNLKLDMFKLNIPLEVENKIKYVCNKIHDIEWSGVLFFTYEGTFEEKNLEITCKDIYIMDIGVSTYTEFEMNPDVISYMAQNPELLDCQMGLIHSHNNMKTFFSGTDLSTLKEEGMDRNNFVSLIVNNEGTYTAAITRKITSKKEYISYAFFGEETEKHDIIENTTTELEYFYLNIVKEGVEEFNDIQSRLDEIKKIKEDLKKKTTICKPSYLNDTSKFDYDFPKQTKLLFEEPKKEIKSDVDEDLLGKIMDGKIKADSTIIKKLTIQLLTGCILMNENSKVDIYKWVDSSMISLYDKRFDDEGGMEAFNYWADSYIDFLMWYTEEPKLFELGLDTTEIAAVLSYGLVAELQMFPKNKYIQCYIENLEKYILL